MVTIREVAKRAGVSVATVSHVINGTRQVSPETAARVRRVMTELDYQINAVAQSLRTRATRVIGVVVSDITNPFFAVLVRGAEDAAHDEGYSLVVCNSDEDPGKEDLYVRTLRRRRTDGLLIAPTMDGSSPVIQELAHQKIPLVFIDRKARDVQADAVLSDNIGGAYEATKYLIRRGHTRIGIVLGIPGATTTEERYMGYRRALDESGIAPSAKLVVHGGYRMEKGSRPTQELLALDCPPTAIFSTNNLMTVGVLRELARSGIGVPKEVEVVSFDDLEWAELLSPPITTVAQDPYGIGHKAVELLLKRLQGESGCEEVRVPVALRIRS